MTCLDFCGGFTARNEDDPIERQVNDFLKRNVEFPEMPADVLSWRQNNKVVVQGDTAVKTVSRTCRLKNGQEKTLTRQITKKLDL